MIATFKSLKSFGMAQAIDDLAEREVRSINYQMKAARSPAHRDLAGFDFAEREVNEALLHSLHRGEFIDDAHNVVLIGGPGTGKMHLATAIRLQAIVHQHRRVRCFSTMELINVLEQEKPLEIRANDPSSPACRSGCAR
jgi:DNA replication protein DnaC